jgi:uncharacterized membrane protein
MSQSTFTKTDYLKALEAELKGLSPGEIIEIVRDTGAHFDEALASGKSEAAAAESLGEPRTLAAGYLAQSALREAPEKGASLSSGSMILFRAMKALFIIAPMNFIFALGPFVLLVVFLIVGWAVSAALAFLAFVGSGLFVTSGGIGSLGLWTGFSVMFFGLATCAAGVLLLLIMFKATEAGLRAVWAWVRFNINFIMAD